jgi:hypothetical protein
MLVEFALDWSTGHKTLARHDDGSGSQIQRKSNGSTKVTRDVWIADWVP